MRSSFSRRTLPVFCAASLLTAAACAAQPVVPSATVLPVAMEPTLIVESLPTVAPPSVLAAEATEAAPVATSRGPDLQASDPETVRLDSGTLQLIEFFRFT